MNGHEENNYQDIPDTPDIGGKTEGSVADNTGSWIKKLRSLLGYRLSFRIVRREKPDPVPVEPSLEQPGEIRPDTIVEPSPEPPKKKAVKKTVKKATPRKPKKKKAVPTRRTNSEKKGHRGAVVGVVSCLAAAGCITAGILLLSGGKTPEDLLEKAHTLSEQEKYSKAQETFQKVLEHEEPVAADTAVDAYLGLTDTYLAESKLDLAVVTLEQGYGETEDERLAEKLDEILPEEDRPFVDKPVTWSDPAFERMVRMALGKLPGSGEILSSELASITTLKIVGGTHAAAGESIRSFNSLDGYTIDGVTYRDRGDITSLADVANFKNLRKLTVSYNRVSDLSGLEELTSLETLGLYANEISDISPLSALSNLRFLYIYGNNINSLTPLSACTQLAELWVQYNEIADLTPLRGLTELKELFVSSNGVSDISSLAGLSHLIFLYADNNRITDIGVVERMPSLTDISFVGNPITDMSPAGDIKHVNLPITQLNL